MAAVKIDGSTYKGYWKLTANTGDPDAFVVYPKTLGVIVTTSNSTEGSIKAGANFDQEFDANTTGGNDEVLNTAAKVIQYIADNK